MNVTLMLTTKDIAIGVLLGLCALTFGVAWLFDIIEARRNRKP